MRSIIACLLGTALLATSGRSRGEIVQWEVASGGNGHYYQRMAEPMGWQEAKALCEKLGGHLATPTSAEENQFIYQTFAKDHVCWLGATDAAKDGEWRWVTGEPFRYQNWFRDEPNNHGGPEDYLTLGSTASIIDGGTSYYYRFGPRWNDLREDGSYHGKRIAFSVCEWDRAPSAFKTAEQDPRGIATHAQSAILQVTDNDQSKLPLHTFCLDANGNILAGVGGMSRTKQSGEIRKFDPDGKYMATWSVPVKPEAIGIGPDGSIYTGGNGRLIKLDAAGKVQITKEGPLVRALMENTPKIREQIVAQAERQKEMLARQIAAYEKRIAAIEEKDEDKQSEREKRMLTSYRRAIEQSRERVKQSRPLSDDQIEQRVQATIDGKRKISSISATAGDVYLACPAAVGYGYDIWRLDENFENAKQIVTGLRGCCGQMDVQAGPDGVFVAENSRKRVCRYDRNGKLIKYWGKAARKGLVGFGSCCNPMNIAFGPEHTIYTAEATTGRIKQYTPDGKLLGLVGHVKIVPGCKNVAIAVSKNGDRVYMMDKTRTHIVLMRRTGEHSMVAGIEHPHTPDRMIAETRTPAPMTPAQQIVHAATKGDVVQVKRLLRTNPELLNTRRGNRTYGSTPLSFAAYNGRTDVVRALLDHGAGLDIANNRGLTPLHEAAGQGHQEIVALLLANGADPNIEDRQRRTALQLATEGRHHEVVKLLREHRPQQE